LSSAEATGKPRSTHPPNWVVFRLAWKDLWHEWILSGCLILALASILSPLLIVLGLKEGFISHLRNDLVQDPVFREVRPAETTQLEPAWFQETGARPDVAFAVPGILRGASIVRATLGDKTVSMDLLPTAPGDPLILENDGVVPGPGEAALSTPAAEELGAKVGDTLDLVVTRTRNNREEAARQPLKIVSVLSERADRLPRVYADLDLVVDVEAYREGRASPDRGWAGSTATPYLSFDALYLVAEEPIRATIRPRLTQGTGFSLLEESTAGDFEAAVGVAGPPGASYYVMRKISGTATTSNIAAVRNRSRGQIDAFLPVVYGIRAEVADATRISEAADAAWSDGLPVSGYSLSEATADRLGMTPPPWGEPKDDPPYREIARIALPAGHALADRQQILARFAIEGGDSPVVAPLRVDGTAPGDHALVPAELAAMLSTARDRPIVYDPEYESLILGERGFRGFRLYAATIDDAPGLVDELKSQGIEVVARVQEILRMQSLDRGLTNLFLLIAVVGAVGGVAALLASLYATVERKRGDLGMMRLLGLSPGRVFAFPVYQGVLISAGGLALSFAVFGLIGTVLNQTFRDELGGDPAVFLPLSYTAIIIGGTLGAAVLSSLAAAIRTTRIEPAEAIRAE